MIQLLVSIFSHPLGWACSAVWFLFVVWCVYRFYRYLFPPAPPQD